MSPEYITGFFDGEGCIHLKVSQSGTWHLQVGISQRYRSVLIDIKDYLGFGRVYFSKQEHKAIYKLTDAKSVLRFIKVVLPYSIVKRDQLMLALFFLENKKSLTKQEQEDISNRLKSLKREWT